jgi:hypothetical protein
MSMQAAFERTMARMARIGIHDPFSQIPPDAVRVDAGFYRTPDGTVYLHAAELLEAAGMKATRANQEWIAQMAKEVSAEHGIPMLRRRLSGR